MTTVACDFGGTRIKVGLVRGGRVLQRAVIDARSDRPLADRLPEVAAVVERLGAAEGIDPRGCRGIGISFPSIILPDGRILGEFGKFGSIAPDAFSRWSGETWGLPVFIENDARLALLGEWTCGAARGCDNAIMITLGTGIGTAAMIGGELLVGAHGQAAILCGHQTVVAGGRPCVCGNLGCAEAEASTSALGVVVEEAAMRLGVAGMAPLPDYEQVFRAAAGGDPVATAVAGRSLAVWGAVAVNMVHAFDPELVVLGGGVMGSGEVILPAIRDYVGRHAQTPWGKVALAAAELGNDAALIGAEAFVNRSLQTEVGP